MMEPIKNEANVRKAMKIIKKSKRLQRLGFHPHKPITINMSLDDMLDILYEQERERVLDQELSQQSDTNLKNRFFLHAACLLLDCIKMPNIDRIEEKIDMGEYDSYMTGMVHKSPLITNEVPLETRLLYKFMSDLASEKDIS